MNFNCILYYCIVAQYFPEIHITVQKSCSLETV